MLTYYLDSLTGVKSVKSTDSSQWTDSPNWSDLVVFPVSLSTLVSEPTQTNHLIHQCFWWVHRLESVNQVTQIIWFRSVSNESADLIQWTGSNESAVFLVSSLSRFVYLAQLLKQQPTRGLMGSGLMETSDLWLSTKIQIVNPGESGTAQLYKELHILTPLPRSSYQPVGAR